MNRLNRSQKEKVKEFMAITECRSEGIAISVLRAHSWNLEMSIHYVFSEGREFENVDPGVLDKIYAKYKEPGEDMILAEGISKFCDDLGVDPSDPVTLVISYYMKAGVMCEYTKEEFFRGFQRMNCDSVEAMKSKVNSLRKELDDPSRFKDVYEFSFGFSREKGQKSLALDTALGMWRLLFAITKWKLCDEWCEFVETKHKKAISKDTWFQLLHFARQFNKDLKGFDDNGAWPYLIDEFVEHYQETHGS